MTEIIEEATPFQRFVLLEVVELDAAGATPAYSFDVYDQCLDRLDDIATDPFGGVTRGEVVDALSVLAADGALAEQRPDDESPVGKGRPGYALAVDGDEVLDALADDGSLASIVQDIRNREG